ncbi:unnamed protein product [Rotaria magnacalcarata]|uniref:Uncharacterized protein n=1 Tax=Rotaria magnacalcarata TaxID=392030 RepID=A0A819PLE2_9BILA|nr:unnamed protein product [Rotaria magnacalcarata]CAF2140387.1 unnamed protein product [Rotaria magnacalcarata]CAF4014689.1 unnamed protein product [Rotaria magnacalcarata]
MSKELCQINDIEMDHYDISENCLGTKGIGPCLCFIILLDDGRIFMEHRSDYYLSSNFTTKNVRLCLKNVIQHLISYPHTAKIKTTIILGGDELKQRFEKFSSRISNLISGDHDDDGDDDDGDDTESQHYQRLLKSIKLINTTFNIDSNAPAIIGECGIDCIVEQAPGDEVVVIIQHVKILHKWDIVTGVMRLSNENSSFAVDQTVTTASKSADENLRIREFRHKCIDHFRKNARAANTVEVEGLLAENLFNYCCSISKRLAAKLSKNERELNADDREMCNVTSTIHADDEEEDDEEQ